VVSKATSLRCQTLSQASQGGKFREKLAVPGIFRP